MDRRCRGPRAIRWAALGVFCLAGLGCGPGNGSRLFRTPAADGFEARNPGPGTSPDAAEPVRQAAFRPEPAPAPTPAAAPAEAHAPLPTEKAMLSHPPYVIEAPDVLHIDAARLVPKPTCLIRPLDSLVVQATGTPAAEPLNGTFAVGADGALALGFGYGTVAAAGLTLEQARAAVQDRLQKTLKTPAVSLELAAPRDAGQIRGEHRVGQDGTISLGSYGSVYVNGLTVGQARAAVEEQLSRFFQGPEVSLEVRGCNSKVYYVVVDGWGSGLRVRRFPVTGNETVLDAVERVGGLPSDAARAKAWVARPAPAGHEGLQILPVDLAAILLGGSTRTNYQLFPGDRVYFTADGGRTDDPLTKLFAPVGGLFGGSR